jgi:hypothetical protein
MLLYGFFFRGGGGPGGSAVRCTALRSLSTVGPDPKGGGEPGHRKRWRQCKGQGTSAAGLQLQAEGSPGPSGL